MMANLIKPKSVMQKIISIFILMLLITACKNKKWQADTSDIKYDFKFQRFEKDFYELDTTHFKASMDALYIKYPDLLKIYTEHLYRDYFKKVKPGDTTAIYENFKKLFFQNKSMTEVYGDVKKAFPPHEIKKIETKLTEALKRYKYFFPKERIPKFYTAMASFGIKAFNTYDKNPCLSLDMYLGSSYKYYNASNIDFPLYVSRRMDKPFIIPDILSSFFESKYDRDSLTDRTILSKMIYAGKTLFFLDLLTPEIPDSVKLGYTKAQMQWCNDYAKEVWKHFNAKEVFFSTDENKRIQYLGDGPFTNAEEMPQESAPRLGEWLGWQLVKTYMEQHSDVTLKQLFMEKDCNKILKGAKYNP
ncbi:MAG: hypothetical protein NTX03_09390 [Bacteroidetes bacterium]|nr:hypothetical protein [Bacteroidota bacterium]